MGRDVLQACLPWLGLLLAATACVYALVRLNDSQMRFGRLRRLHGDELGSAQSLSFVLTLPFFVMTVLFIVQVSQLMIATIVVHYAAFAAARSAVVWIPADIGSPEQAGCLSAFFPDPEAPDQAMPVLDPMDENYGPAEGGVTYLVEPGSPKYEKIASAAVLGCMSISPSRDLGLQPASPGVVEILDAAYGSMATRSSAGRNAVSRRLRNKLAYAQGNTRVEIRFYHKNLEPPLATYFLEDDVGEFYFNEVGWQDPVTVTVQHDLALLPGPGRLLARLAVGPYVKRDRVRERIRRLDNVYVYPLTASATLGNEGEKPVIPYVHEVY